MGLVCLATLATHERVVQVALAHERNEHRHAITVIPVRLPVMRDRTSVTDTNIPALPGVERVLKDQLGNTNVLRCPSDRAQLFAQTGSSYSWNSLLNGQRADDLKVMGLSFDSHAIPVFFDKEGFHAARGAKKEVNYLYADGHIKNLLAIEGTLKK